LPILDNLENASKANTDDKAYQEGVVMVYNQFLDVLKKFNVETIETVGKTFDPEFHEAVSHIDDDTKGPQEIVQEYRKGYKIGLKVIRHSMVVVAN
jgi:molecular chaperone GrpE